MNHTSQKASFPPSSEETPATKECLFCLMIAPSAQYLLRLSLDHWRRQTLLLRGEKSSSTHSHRSLLSFCHKVNHLGEIFSAREDAQRGSSEWGNLTTWSQPGLWWARRNEREIFFCARGITMLFWKRVTSRRTVGVNDRFIVELMILQRSPPTHTV